MTQSPSRITFVAPVLQVSDLARSIAYYRHQLGFDVEFEYEGFYASVLRDGCRVHLNCAAPAARDQQAFEAAEHLDACFGVVDAQALASEFATAGATIPVPLRRMPYGQEFYVRDPDGYILGFIQPDAMQGNDEASDPGSCARSRAAVPASPGFFGHRDLALASFSERSGSVRLRTPWK